MKTKLIMLITGIVLSVSLSANEMTENEECVRNLIQTEVKSEFLNWDFSTLNENNAVADISFQVNEKGNVEVKEIAGKDSEFNSLIETNLSKIKLDADCLDNEMEFYIRLSYKKR